MDLNELKQLENDVTRVHRKLKSKFPNDMKLPFIDCGIWGVDQNGMIADFLAYIKYLEQNDKEKTTSTENE